MTHQHTDWLNANKYTPEERRKMCHDLLGEAQHWDCETYLRYMHDSTKREPLTDELVNTLYQNLASDKRTKQFTAQNWFQAGLATGEAAHGIKEKNT